MSKEKRKKVRRLGRKVVVLFYVIAFILIDYSLYERSQGVEVDAQITNINIQETNSDEDSESKQVYVSYEYKGKKYENIPLSYSDFTMITGQRIKVHLDPKTPTYLYSWKVKFRIGVLIAVANTAYIVVCKIKKRKL